MDPVRGNANTLAVPRPECLVSATIVDSLTCYLMCLIFIGLVCEKFLIDPSGK